MAHLFFDNFAPGDYNKGKTRPLGGKPWQISLKSPIFPRRSWMFWAVSDDPVVYNEPVCPVTLSREIISRYGL